MSARQLYQERNIYGEEFSQCGPYLWALYDGPWLEQFPSQSLNFCDTLEVDFFNLTVRTELNDCRECTRRANSMIRGLQ